MKDTPNPIAHIAMKNGVKIIIELIPELAPNTVNSFIYLAGNGAFDDYKIARVEPGFVVDVSTNAFGRDICRYLIRNEAGDIDKKHRLRPELGVIAMGGYDGNIAGSEFFFPLRYVPRLDGNYPCFGKIIDGIEEIVRISRVPVEEFSNDDYPSMIMHKPLSDETIATVRVETHGVIYPEPARLETAEFPKHWLTF